MRFSLCLLSVIVTLWSAANSANAQNTGALLEKIIELIDDRDYRTAESLSRRVISQDPDNALGNYYLAEALAKQGNLAEALKYYKATARLSPNSKPGIDALGRVDKVP